MKLGMPDVYLWMLVFSGPSVISWRFAFPSASSNILAVAALQARIECTDACMHAYQHTTVPPENG